MGSGGSTDKAAFGAVGRKITTSASQDPAKTPDAIAAALRDESSRSSAPRRRAARRASWSMTYYHGAHRLPHDAHAHHRHAQPAERG